MKTSLLARIVAFCAFSSVALTCGFSAVKKKVPVRSSSVRGRSSKGSRASASRSSSKSSSSKRGVTTAQTWRNRQAAPSADRYKEIQQVLIQKGYMAGEPSGVWDSQSSDALKRFQTDQKLSPTGKINAASLIGLGLGPKHNNPPQQSPSASSAPGNTESPLTP